jgi:hypothetical protein
MAPPGVIVEHLRDLAARMEQRATALEGTEAQVRAGDPGSSSLPYAVASIRAGIHISRARAAWVRETIDVIEKHARRQL